MSHKAWGWCRLGWNLPIRKIASRKDAVGFTPGMRDEASEMDLANPVRVRRDGKYYRHGVFRKTRGQDNGLEHARKRSGMLAMKG